ncbi:MAG: Rap1a/Tai family immunity protein [Candidatus Korobacteraceae bacterium]|jgi:Ssp1 endopeptidase immunity protein Rap1a
MKAVLGLVLSCALTWSAHAANDYPGDSGNAFVRTCSGIDRGDKDKTNVDLQKEVACVGYISGLVDGVTAEIAFTQWEIHKNVPGPYCLPEEVENGQLIRVVLKYVKDHPEKAHMRTGPLAVLAWQKAFPCR